jgi:hypothetical protein
MVGRKFNDICIWSDPLQHLESVNATSLQFLNGSRWEPLRFNPDHDRISYAKCSVMPM